jgi:dynein assembly factor with WDR repeat domains 1
MLTCAPREYSLFHPPYYLTSRLPSRTCTRTDKTCKLWSAETGQLYHTYKGHATEIVCLSFNPHGTMIATGSMDNTSRLWDVETGECLHTLLGHTAEIVSLDFDTQGQRIITGSFDNTVKVGYFAFSFTVHPFVNNQSEFHAFTFIDVFYYYQLRYDFV